MIEVVKMVMPRGSSDHWRTALRPNGKWIGRIGFRSGIAAPALPENLPRPRLIVFQPSAWAFRFGERGGSFTLFIPLSAPKTCRAGVTVSAQARSRTP